MGAVRTGDAITSGCCCAVEPSEAVAEAVAEAAVEAVAVKQRATRFPRNKEVSSPPPPLSNPISNPVPRASSRSETIESIAPP